MDEAGARALLAARVGGPAPALDGAARLLAEGRLAAALWQRHPARHDVTSEAALYDRVVALQRRHLRHAPTPQRVAWDPALRRAQQALGTHTAVSRVQGGRLKARREIRIASVFKQAPDALLRMIVAHEVAHLKEPAHDRAFYALCRHLEPDYVQLEFDTRLWLVALEHEPPPHRVAFTTPS